MKKARLLYGIRFDNGKIHFEQIIIEADFLTEKLSVENIDFLEKSYSESCARIYTNKGFTVWLISYMLLEEDK